MDTSRNPHKMNFSIDSINDKHKLFISRFIKFIGVGAFGTLVHYIILICTIQLFHLNAVLASSLGAIFGALVNYYLNYHFTFESNKRHVDAMSKFFTVATIGFVLNGLLMTLFTQQYTIHYLIAQIITTGIILIWNFLGNHFWTFNEKANQTSNNFQENIIMNSKVSIPSGFVRWFITEWKTNTPFKLIFIFSFVYLFMGAWWGWPGTFDQHDPTRFAIKMLEQRSLDSGRRYYGLFGYQEVLFFSVIPITILKKLFSLDASFSVSLMFLITRIIWAIKALGIVLMTYFISTELFRNQRAALISMFLVALSPGFIAWTHIPQLDTVHAFWYTLTIAFTVAGWSRSSIKLLWMAAITAGLAASVKYIGGFIVLAPIIVAFLRLPLQRAFIYGSLFMITALSIFFITTPLATGSPIQWLPGFTADILVNQHREVEKPLAFWTMPGTISDMIGPAAAIMGGVCALFYIVSVIRNRNFPKQSWIVLLACFLPYYLGISWQHVSTVRYLLPLISVILIGVGLFASVAFEKKSLKYPLLICLVLVSIVQIPLTTALVIGFSTDTRVELLSWLEKNTVPTDQVETIVNHRRYFATTPPFIEVTRPHFQTESYEMKKFVDEDKDSTVRKLHDTFVKLSGKDPDKYLTWLDRERIWLKRSALTFDTSINGPVTRNSKYVVLNINTATHYILDWHGFDPESPKEKDFIRALLTEKEPFQLVAQFDPIIPEWLRYPKELWRNISPPIRVYKVLKPDSQNQI